MIIALYKSTFTIPYHTITYHYTARGGPSHGHMQHAQKIGEDRTRSSEDMIADRQTHRQTDTLVTIIRSPIGGGVISITFLRLAVYTECRVFHRRPSTVQHVLVLCDLVDYRLHVVADSPLEFTLLCQTTLTNLCTATAAVIWHPVRCYCPLASQYVEISCKC